MSQARQIADGFSELDGMDRNSPYAQAMRVAKIVEEAGEVAQAVIAFHNANPLKPGGSIEDVVKELADIAITAKVSIENFGFDAETVVSDREFVVLGRVRRALESRAGEQR